ncbi:MAG: hypothetical protein WCV62_05685 [Candidatus Peribacteraceae bacterium]|jgi:hypothetical protein
MGFLRSVQSNPIESAIKSFGEMSDILQKRDEAPLRRELLAQEIADKKLSSEKTRAEMDQKAKENEEWSRATGIKKVDDETKATLGHLLGADAENEAAKAEGRDPNYTPEQQDAVFKTLGKNPLLDPDKVDVQTDAIRKVRGFIKEKAPQLMKGGVLNREQAPDTFDAFDTVFEPQINRGTDRYGNDAKSGVTKKVKAVIVDPKDGSLSFVLDVTAPAYGTRKPSSSENDYFAGNPGVAGMADFESNTVVLNPYSKLSDKEKNAVIRNEQARLVMKKKNLSPSFDLTPEQEKSFADYGVGDKQAIRETIVGRIISGDPSALNVTPEQKAFAETVREQLDSGGETNTYDAPLTADRAGGDPNAPVVKLPAGVLDQYLGAHEGLGTKIQQLRARLDPKEFAKKMEEIKRTRAENKAVSAAMAKVDTSKSTAEQRNTFITEFTKLAPDSSVKETTELAKTIIGEKEALQSEAGKTVSDRVRLVTRFGEGSPQVKAFDEAAGEKKAEKGLAKTIYGPKDSKGQVQTKEVFIEKGKEYVPPKGWSLKAPEAGAEDRDEDRRLRRVDSQSAQAERIYEKNDKKLDASTKDQGWIDGERDRLADEKAESLRLIEGGMNASQAIEKARKKFPPRLVAITKVARDSIVKKFKDMKNGPAKQKAMEEEAKGRGYDPSKVEGE